MCIILSMVENSGFSRNILKEKWRSTEVTVANLYTVVCRKRVEWVSCFRNLQTAGIPLVTPGLETELGVFSLTGYPRVESRSRVTLSCCWFFSFPSFMLLLCKLSIEQTTFGQARNVRYRWKTRTGYLQERLRRQFAWGDHPRERRCLLGSNQNICKAWPEAESKKSYQRVGRDFQPLWSRLHFGHRWVIGIYRVE